MAVYVSQAEMFTELRVNVNEVLFMFWLFTIANFRHHSRLTKLQISQGLNSTKYKMKISLFLHFLRPKMLHITSLN